MFIICDRSDQAILAYPDGSLMVFVNEELAHNHVVAISQNNPGQWFVARLFDDRFKYWARACVKYHNPLQVRGIRTDHLV